MKLVKKNLVILFVLIFPQSFCMDYIKPDKVIESSVKSGTNWLYDAAADGIKAGVENVTKQILTEVGKALLESYSSAISEIIFGSDNELEKFTKEIIGEIQKYNGLIYDDLKEIADILHDQYEAEQHARFTSSLESYQTWMQLDLKSRIRDHNMTLLISITQDLRFLKNIVAQYISREGDERGQIRRIKELLPLYITIVQLIANCDSSYYKLTEIINAKGSMDFDQWYNSLSTEEINNLDKNDQDSIEQRNILYEETINFFNDLAEQEYIIKYIEDIYTPIVSHMNLFNGDIQLYEKSEEVNEMTNWGVPPNDSVVWNGTQPGSAVLDGLRLYYYVNIPEEKCLEGFAWKNLLDNSTIPWKEKIENSADSDCNRFWIVDLIATFPSLPNTYLASFDGYSVWFDSENQIYDLHKKLMLGDLLKPIYGPTSLILDRMYEEINDGQKRPRNKWDLVFSEYDKQVALLGVTNSFYDGVSYNDLVEADEYLESLGVTPENNGLSSWFEMVKKYIEENQNLKKVFASLQEAKFNYDWMWNSTEDKFTRNEIEWFFLRENNFFDRYKNYSKQDLISKLKPQILSNATARFISSYN